MNMSSYTGPVANQSIAPPQSTRLDTACNTLVDKCDTIDSLLKELQNRINPILVNVPRAIPPSQLSDKTPVQDIQCDMMLRMGVFAERLQGIINNISGTIENVNI